MEQEEGFLSGITTCLHCADPMGSPNVFFPLKIKKDENTRNNFDLGLYLLFKFDDNPKMSLGGSGLSIHVLPFWLTIFSILLDYLLPVLFNCL